MSIFSTRDYSAAAAPSKTRQLRATTQSTINYDSDKQDRTATNAFRVVDFSTIAIYCESFYCLRLVIRLLIIDRSTICQHADMHWFNVDNLISRPLRDKRHHKVCRYTKPVFGSH